MGWLRSDFVKPDWVELWDDILKNIQSRPKKKRPNEQRIVWNLLGIENHGPPFIHLGI